MAVSVIEPIITVCPESARILSRPNYHREYRFDVPVAEEFADENGWTGFAFVFGPDGEALAVPGGYLFGHMCEYIRDAVNARAAFKIIADATGEPRDAGGTGGYVCSEWHGYLAYDHGNPLAEQAAQRIGSGLSDGCLDDADMSAQLRANGITGLIDAYKVPESLAESVMDALSDFGGCFECTSPDVHAAMRELGFAECADCPEWVATGGKPGELLCYDCAEYRGDCAGECMSVFVDTMRHGSHVITVEKADSACTGECRDGSDDE